MKNYFILLVFLVSLKGRAQAIDTIFANEHHNVAIFFPEKIRQAVVGAENFVFSYNQEHPQYFGLLKGRVGKTSNLLAISQGGEIFSYVLSYKEELPRFIYFLDKEASLGNEQPKYGVEMGLVSSEIPLELKETDSLQRMIYLGNLASYYLKTSTGKLKKRKKNGITLQMNQLIHYRGDVFVVFEIGNKSNIDFETEYLRLYLSQGNRKRNASYQKILKEPLFTYKFPEIIPQGQKKRFVYVLPKFTIGEKEKVEVELREKKGNRFLNLKFKK